MPKFFMAFPTVGVRPNRKTQRCQLGLVRIFNSVVPGNPRARQTNSHDRVVTVIRPAHHIFHDPPDILFSVGKQVGYVSDCCACAMVLVSCSLGRGVIPPPAPPYASPWPNGERRESRRRPRLSCARCWPRLSVPAATSCLLLSSCRTSLQRRTRCSLRRGRTEVAAVAVSVSRSPRP
jgi:hypothetical protein